MKYLLLVVVLFLIVGCGPSTVEHGTQRNIYTQYTRQIQELCYAGVDGDPIVYLYISSGYSAALSPKLGKDGIPYSCDPRTFGSNIELPEEQCTTSYSNPACE